MRGYQRLVNKTGEVNVGIAFALKGQNEIAQGNALGKWHTKTPSPERAKGVDKWLLRPFRAYLMWDLLPGVALRSTPGYLISPLRGLRAIAHHSRKSVESMDIKCQEWNSAYAKLTKAAKVTNSREAGPFGKLRGRFPFSTALRQAQGPVSSSV